MNKIKLTGVRSVEKENVKYFPYKAGSTYFYLITDTDFIATHYMDGKRGLAARAKQGEGVLLATWQGNWRTDVFEIDPALALKELG